MTSVDPAMGSPEGAREVLSPHATEFADYGGESPFFMTLASDGDHWCFISSTGALTAGRVDAAGAMFPYVTEDKIHDSYGVTGPRTLVRLADGSIWEPFAPWERFRSCRRTLRKGAHGNWVTFIEERAEPALRFEYTWQSAGRLGFVRTAKMTNLGEVPVECTILDGLTNILPPGIPEPVQTGSSCLADAYKISERIGETSLAVFSTAAAITDLPFPRENLHAAAVWSTGLGGARVHLLPEAPDQFRAGRDFGSTGMARGVRSAYWLQRDLGLGPGGIEDWRIVIDSPLDASEVLQIHEHLEEEERDPGIVIQQALIGGQERLACRLAAADAMQCTGLLVHEQHHAANVLFNIMRGGLFLNGYALPADDFLAYLESYGNAASGLLAARLTEKDGWYAYGEVARAVATIDDPDLSRYFGEYLPITFSRRHGDPSRPWNRFSIRTEDAAGRPRFAYEGNWRDIFQNWEALCVSFPGWLIHVIFRFLNTSTIDGYNPYRLTSEGFDWEEIDPDDPWGGIGYWGDHQIIYLQRLLEAIQAMNPGSLERWLDAPVFVFAEVPYRIRSFAKILENPRSSLDFARKRSQELRAAFAAEGRDALYRKDSGGDLLRVSMRSKLLLPALVKLVNFVPGGGIWLNTERPEWNDANNAIVGYGASIVTVQHLRRYLAFALNSWAGADHGSEVSLFAPVAGLLEDLASILTGDPERIRKATTDEVARGSVFVALNGAGESFRTAAYGELEPADRVVQVKDLRRFLSNVIAWLDATIRDAKRSDGLFDGYNILDFGNGGRQVTVKRLYPMLEGQVAALSSGTLDPSESADLVDALFHSSLYRADRKSFMLYPDRKVGSFVDRARIVRESVSDSALLAALRERGDDRLVRSGRGGSRYFHADIVDEASLARRLAEIGADPELDPLVESERTFWREQFEEVFRHREFTGRSSTMFAYEGLGSIYWHMVAKLLLAVQEQFWQALGNGADTRTQSRLADQYFRIRDGLGYRKTAEQYGAFPTDPYSHTPGHSGARQPGMTGQVKEEILTRWGELGLLIRDGRLHFSPALLERCEFLDSWRNWAIIRPDGSQEDLKLEPGQLGFTFGQVPFIYCLGKGYRVRVVTTDGVMESATPILESDVLDRIIGRDTTLRRIEVTLPEETLRGADLL